MRYSSSILAAAALAGPLLASARPVRRGASATDALVLQFANVLEQLETNFYMQGLAKFQASDFSNAGFSSSMVAVQTISTIGADEATHTSFLQQALTDNGATPLTCNFDFSSALTDVPTMLATARVVENVGVSAYLGGATLLDDPRILDAAASILTNEARHQSSLNILSGTGSSIPSAFDVSLTPTEVLAIAGPFITGPCDTGITAGNPLKITNTGSIQPGTSLQFSGTNVTSSGQFCNMMVGGATFSINLPIDQCVVPPGVNGPVYIWITSDNDPLANNVVDRNTKTQIAGPTLLFVDSQPEMLGQLVRSSGTSSGATSSSTTTISPDQASSIIAGAGSSTATGAAAAAASTGSSASSSNGSSAPVQGASVGPSPDGPSADGKLTVNGITMVPKPAAASGAASAVASSAAAPSASA